MTRRNLHSLSSSRVLFRSSSLYLPHQSSIHVKRMIEKIMMQDFYSTTKGKMSSLRQSIMDASHQNEKKKFTRLLRIPFAIFIIFNIFQIIRVTSRDTSATNMNSNADEIISPMMLVDDMKNNTLKM